MAKAKLSKSFSVSFSLPYPPASNASNCLRVYLTISSTAFYDVLSALLMLSFMDFN